MLALPEMYKNLSFLGLIRFCTIICMFSDFVPCLLLFPILLYRGTRAYMRICSDFVFILFIFGNMIQKIAICVLL